MNLVPNVLERSTMATRKPSKKDRRRLKERPISTRGAPSAYRCRAQPSPGATDHLEMTVDTVWAMRKRRQIDEPSWLAAQTYRRAYDTVGAEIGGIMDFDRVRGGGSGAGYSEAQLVAAGYLREASALLGQIDGHVVLLVVGCNWTIAEAAYVLCGRDERTERAIRKDCEHIGERLRMALRTLANKWHPGAKSRLRGWRDEDAKPATSQAGQREIEIGAVPMSLTNRRG